LEGQLETAQGAVFSAKQHLDTINGGAAAAEAQQALSSLGARIARTTGRCFSAFDLAERTFRWRG